MSNQGQEQLDSLTGLRFFAAMMVFVNHVLFAFPALSTEGMISDVFEPLGTAGVCFFYVLSGFILTYVYSSRTGPISKREFYLKRIARIWPLHLVSLVIVLFFVMTLQYQLKQPQGAAQIVANVFLVQAWWPEYRWVFCINGPSWSLSNEAFFYFMFPWLVAGGVTAFGRKFVVFTVAGFAVLIGLSLVPDNVLSESSVSCIIHTNPLVRLFDFMTGMACGFLYLNSRKRASAMNEVPGNRSSGSNLMTAVAHVVTLLGAVVYFVVLHKGFNQSGMWYTPSLGAGNVWLSVNSAAPVFAITIFAYAWSSSWVSKFFGSKVMVYLGEISFAFYLIHQAFLATLSRQTLSDSPNAMGWLAVAALFLSLAAAILLHHLVELPSRAGFIQMFSTAGSSGTNPKPGWLARCGTWLNEYAIGAWRLCVSPKIVAMVGLVIAGYLFVDAGLFNVRDAGLIQAVIDQSEDKFRGVQFDQDAVLRGLEIDPQADGSYRLQMVWDLKEGRRPTRFLHFVDSSGKLLRQGDANRALFSRATGDDVVLDRIFVSKDELESAAMLALGFYGPDRKSAKIVNPVPGQPTHRLPILQLD